MYIILFNKFKLIISKNNLSKISIRTKYLSNFSKPHSNIKFLSENFFVDTPKFFSTKCLFWRSCAGLHATIECSSKIHCQTCRFQPYTTLGGGVKREKTVFFPEF